jgi:NADH-quinone oxidoreductase subunit A
MQQASQLTEFGKIFLFIIIGILLVLGTFLLSKIIAPNKPTPEKLTSYECGEEPEGNSWLQFNPRFYVIALVFLLFDVEMAFIFPWATIFGQEALIAADSRWGWFTLTEMFIFIGILILGLVYVWRKGDLEWIRPIPYKPKVDTAIPLSVYDRINTESYTIKPFVSKAEPVLVQEAEASVSESSPKPRPMFKSTFRKTEK